MDNPYCFDIEFITEELGNAQNIEDSLPVAKVHHAHLYDSPEKIDIRIHFDPKTYFHRKFDAWLNKLIPHAPQFDVFISYAAGDSAIADELRSDLEKNGLKCFMVWRPALWEDQQRI